MIGSLFPRTVADVSVVFHRSSPLLDLAHPLVPVERLLTASAARRYVVGSTSRQTIHVLAPGVLLARASNVAGSREMLARAPDVLYTRLVVGLNNRRLPPPSTPGRLRHRLRWAWLVEGAARYFAGQVEHARPAIARRLRSVASASTHSEKRMKNTSSAAVVHWPTAAAATVPTVISVWPVTRRSRAAAGQEDAGSKVIERARLLQVMGDELKYFFEPQRHYPA